MKSSELHRLIIRNGWRLIRTTGSHYLYAKDGKIYPVPFHGSKEVGKGIEKKIKKEMGLSGAQSGDGNDKKDQDS